MTILNEILGSLEGDAAVSELRAGVRATAVWSRRLGLAYTFPRVHRGSSTRLGQKPRRLRDRSARELAELALSEDPIDASIGAAAINSLLDPEELQLDDGKAFDLILEKGEGKSVTVVGHFPFVEKLRERVAELWVLELTPREGDLPASEAARVIPRSDVVAITGTSLINHTIEPLLELARDAFTIVLGPSTPLSPVFFDWQVDAICSSVVVEPELALLDVSEGASFRFMSGLRPVNATRRGEPAG
jgi:uncharacterized protein